MLTVVDGDSLTRTSTCFGQDCTGKVSSLTTGPASAFPTSISRGPFTNDTNPSDTERGPTGTGASLERNSTTSVHKTITLSVTTFTNSEWSIWKNGSASTETRPSNVSTSCTTDKVWSNKTSIHSSKGLTSSARSTISHATRTSVSEDHTTTAVVATPPRSYVSTATYTFAETTIEIPIPASYTGSLPIIKEPLNTPSPARFVGETPAPRIYAPPNDTQVSAVSPTTYSSCFTTTNKASSGSAPIATAETNSTLICWGYYCNADSVCTDFMSRYPLAASTSGSYANSTATSPIGYGTDYESTTAQMYNTNADSPAKQSHTASLWPEDPTNEARNSAAYTHTGPVPPPLGPGTSETFTTASTGITGTRPIIVNAVSVTTLYTSTTNPDGRPVFSAYTTITFTNSSQEPGPTAPANHSNHWAVWPSGLLASPTNVNDLIEPTATASAFPAKTDVNAAISGDQGHVSSGSWMHDRTGQSRRQRAAIKVSRERSRMSAPMKHEDVTAEAREKKFNVLLGKKREEAQMIDAAMAEGA